MPGKSQVLDIVAAGCGCPEVGRRLRIPPGRAYLIGTGLPAKGGDTVQPQRARLDGDPRGT